MIEILKSEDEQFYYVVKAKNNKVLVTSETYRKKQSCHKGIESLIKTMDGKIEVKDLTDEHGSSR